LAGGTISVGLSWKAAEEKGDVDGDGKPRSIGDRVYPHGTPEPYIGYCATREKKSRGVEWDTARVEGKATAEREEGGDDVRKADHVAREREGKGEGYGRAWRWVRRDKGEKLVEQLRVLLFDDTDSAGHGVTCITDDRYTLADE